MCELFIIKIQGQAIKRNMTVYFIYLSLCMSIYLSITMYCCLSIYHYESLSIYLSIYLSCNRFCFIRSYFAGFFTKWYFLALGGCYLANTWCYFIISISKNMSDIRKYKKIYAFEEPRVSFLIVACKATILSAYIIKLADFSVIIA